MQLISTSSENTMIDASQIPVVLITPCLDTTLQSAQSCTDAVPSGIDPAALVDATSTKLSSQDPESSSESSMPKTVVGDSNTIEPRNVVRSPSDALNTDVQTWDASASTSPTSAKSVLPSYEARNDTGSSLIDGDSTYRGPGDIPIVSHTSRLGLASGVKTDIFLTDVKPPENETHAARIILKGHSRQDQSLPSPVEVSERTSAGDFDHQIEIEVVESRCDHQVGDDGRGRRDDPVTRQEELMAVSHTSEMDRHQPVDSVDYSRGSRSHERNNQERLGPNTSTIYQAAESGDRDSVAAIPGFPRDVRPATADSASDYSVSDYSDDVSDSDDSGGEDGAQVTAPSIVCDKCGNVTSLLMALDEAGLVIDSSSRQEGDETSRRHKDGSSNSKTRVEGTDTPSDTTEHTSLSEEVSSDGNDDTDTTNGADTDSSTDEATDDPLTDQDEGQSGVSITDGDTDMDSSMDADDSTDEDTNEALTSDIEDEDAVSSSQSDTDTASGADTDSSTTDDGTDEEIDETPTSENEVAIDKTGSRGTTNGHTSERFTTINKASHLVMNPSEIKDDVGSKFRSIVPKKRRVTFLDDPTRVYGHRARRPSPRSDGYVRLRDIAPAKHLDHTGAHIT